MTSIEELLNFIYSKNPIYVNNDLKIVFHNNISNRGLINIKHHGWKCPSCYGDNPSPEDGYGNIDECYRDKQGKLVINFESMDYSRRNYLSIGVLSTDIILIRYDDYCRNGMKLTRLK